MHIKGTFHGGRRLHAENAEHPDMPRIGAFRHFSGNGPGLKNLLLSHAWLLQECLAGHFESCNSLLFFMHYC